MGGQPDGANLAFGAKHCLRERHSVFDNSALHVNIRQPTWIAETHHSLKNWFSGAEDALGIQDENARKILHEKDEAVSRSEALYQQVAAANPGLKPKAYEDLLQRFDFLRLYAEGFRLTTRIYIFSRLLAERANKQPAFLKQPPRELLKNTVDELKAYKERVKKGSFCQDLPGQRASWHRTARMLPAGCGKQAANRCPLISYLL